MAMPTIMRNRHRYLGDTATRRVHDIDRQIPGPEGCGIDQLLRAGHAVCFVPNTLSQANRAGYDRCPKCLAGPAR